MRIIPIVSVSPGFVIIPRQSFTKRSVADILPATLYPKKGNTMTTPTFDTIEAQASYGIGLQVGNN
ncbi:hypothetical protein ACNKHT_28050 [Shigella flexneri]